MINDLSSLRESKVVELPSVNPRAVVPEIAFLKDRLYKAERRLNLLIELAEKDKRTIKRLEREVRSCAKRLASMQEAAEFGLDVF